MQMSEPSQSYIQIASEPLTDNGARQPDHAPEVPTGTPENKIQSRGNLVGEEICFGMVRDKAELIHDTRELLTDTQIANAQIGIPDQFCIDDRFLVDILAAKKSSQSLNLTYREHYFVLQTFSGLDVAILDTRTTKPLRALLKLKLIRFQAFPAVDGSTREELIWKRKGKVMGITVNIYVYGCRDIYDRAGKILSGSGIYLQHPDHLEENIEYDNPHFLKLPGQRILTRNGFQMTHHSGGGLNDSLDVDINNILDMLKRPKCLYLAHIDSRVRTSLLR